MQKTLKFRIVNFAFWFFVGLFIVWFLSISVIGTMLSAFMKENWFWIVMIYATTPVIILVILFYLLIIFNDMEQDMEKN